MAFKSRLLPALFSFLFANSSLAQTQKKLNVAVLGDSITRGVLADDKLGEDASLNDALSFIRLAGNGATAGFLPDKEGVLSYQLMTKNEYMARDELAAVQGKKAWSIASRLQNELGYQVDLINAAKLGGSFRMGDIQLAVLEREMKKRGLQSLDLVIVDLGRIDLSIFSNEEEFQRHVDSFFQEILKVSPGSRYIFTKIPNIPSSISRENRVSARFIKKFSLTCEQIFSLGGVATKTGLIPGKSDAAAYQRALDRMASFNRYLSEKVSSFQAAGVSIELVESLVDRARPDDWDQIMAADCIHLNEVGQQEIATSLWPHVQSILKEKAEVVEIPVERNQAEGITEKAARLWDSYVATLPLNQIQEECRPRMVPHQGAYKGVVVLFHGFTACPQQYFPLSEELAAAGYTVLLPLNPGHGRQYTTKDGINTDNIADLPTGRANDPNSYLKYFDFVVNMNAIAREFGGERVVGGLSLGAAMASFATVQDPLLWTRQIIMSPLYELDQAVIHNVMGTLSNINNFNRTLGNLLDPILQMNQGWGQGCENERTLSWVAQYDRTGTRAGICQFKITHVLAANQFGFDAWNLIQPTRIKTQFVVVQDDPVINKQLVFNGVGRIRGEQLKFKSFETTKRLDQDERARICYVPSSNLTCADNLNKPLAEQTLNCANHSLLSRFDAPNQNKYWIDILQPKLVNFITKGEFVPAGNGRAHNDPLCAGFAP